MNSKLHESVKAAISRHRMLVPGDAVGVAVSGGADSVALLLLLEELREELGLRLIVLHFNHQLRGAEADADEQFVAQLAAKRGLALFSAREDVAAAAHANRWNLEDAARRLRYNFFSSVIESGRAQRVAVAHTADDQAETVLAHLVRGTGPTGLAAIYPVAGHVIRPLLAVRRVELREYLTELGQPWREDASNKDTARLRARIRHQLLPQLERDFQPEIVARLGQLASLAREDAEFWDLFLADRFHALTEKIHNGVAIRVGDLLSPLHVDQNVASTRGRPPLEALSKRLVRRIVAEIRGGPVQLAAQHVEQVIHLATECVSGSRVQLPGGIVVEKALDRLVFSLSAHSLELSGGHKTDSPAKTYEYSVELGGPQPAAVSVPEIGRRFRLKVIDWPPDRSDTRSLAEALDWDLLRSPLVLRNWRPGDSYRPCGRRQAHKLKRLLLASRVPAPERAGWPVLTSAGSLVWARGLPVADDFAARPGTTTGLVVAEEDL
jgi:tRNA(Ile)-lysidine synthase